MNAKEDRLRLLEEHMPALAQVMQALEREGQVFTENAAIQSSYGNWRTVYTAALEEHFDTYHKPGLLTAGSEQPDEEELENRKLFFVDDAVEKDIAGMARNFYRDRQGLTDEIRADRTRLIGLHLGTLENIYLRDRDAAADQSADWASRVKQGPGPGRGRGGEEEE